MMNSVEIPNFLFPFRYALVAFGGEHPFDKPRTVTLNGEVFASYNKFEPYFRHLRNINPGQNNDVFSAIITASKLIFRPGASKIFILVPCTNCSSLDTRVRGF